MDIPTLNVSICQLDTKDDEKMHIVSNLVKSFEKLYKEKITVEVDDYNIDFYVNVPVPNIARYIALLSSAQRKFRDCDEYVDVCVDIRF